MDEDETFGNLTVEERQDEVRLFFEQTNKPFTTSSEVADKFNTERSVAYRTLEELLKSGFFYKERVGAGGVVYYQQYTTE